jgi:flagellar biosynthesis protein FliQ
LSAYDSSQSKENHHVAYDRTKDNYRDQSASFAAQARLCVAVTPSDAAALAAYAKALRIYVPSSVPGGVATVRVTPIQAVNDSDTVTLSFVPGVTIEPLAVRQVWATGTTAGVELHAYTV